MVSITCPFTLRVKFQWINNYPTLNTTQHFVYHWDQIPFPMFTFFNKFYSWWCWKQWQCDAYGWEIVKLFTQLLRNITNRVSNVFKVCISVHQNSRAHSIMSMTKPWPSSWPSSKPSSGSSLKTQVEHYKRFRILSTLSDIIPTNKNLTNVFYKWYNCSIPNYSIWFKASTNLMSYCTAMPPTKESTQL